MYAEYVATQLRSTTISYETSAVERRGTALYQLSFRRTWVDLDRHGGRAADRELVVRLHTTHHQDLRKHRERYQQLTTERHYLRSRFAAIVRRKRGKREKTRRERAKNMTQSQRSRTSPPAGILSSLFRTSQLYSSSTHIRSPEPRPQAREQSPPLGPRPLPPVGTARRRQQSS